MECVRTLVMLTPSQPPFPPRPPSVAVLRAPSPLSRPPPPTPPQVSRGIYTTRLSLFLNSRSLARYALQTEHIYSTPPPPLAPPSTLPSFNGHNVSRLKTFFPLSRYHHPFASFIFLRRINRGLLTSTEAPDLIFNLISRRPAPSHPCQFFKRISRRQFLVPATDRAPSRGSCDRFTAAREALILIANAEGKRYLNVYIIYFSFHAYTYILMEKKKKSQRSLATFPAHTFSHINSKQYKIIAGAI